MTGETTSHGDAGPQTHVPGDLAVALVTLTSFVLLLWVRQNNWPLYRVVVDEDGPVENLTALLFGCAAVFAGALATTAWRARSHLAVTLLAAVISALFVVMLLEEISWGQRMFGYATPEYFRQSSTQDELTVHNLKPVQDVLDYLFIAAGLYGMLSGAVLGPLLRHGAFRASTAGQLLDLVVVPTRYAPVFFPIFLDNVAWHFFRDSPWLGWIRQPDEEPAEMYFALACCLYIRHKQFWFTPAPSDAAPHG